MLPLLILVRGGAQNTFAITPSAVYFTRRYCRHTIRTITVNIACCANIVSWCPCASSWLSNILLIFKRRALSKVFLRDLHV